MGLSLKATEVFTPELSTVREDRVEHLKSLFEACSTSFLNGLYAARACRKTFCIKVLQKNQIKPLRESIGVSMLLVSHNLYPTFISQ